MPYVPSPVLLFPLVLQTVTITRTNTNMLRLNYFNSSTGTNGDVITDIYRQPIPTFYLHGQHTCLQAKLCRLPSEWISWSVFEFGEDISLHL